MNIGKKILSAFVEVTEEAKPLATPAPVSTPVQPRLAQPAADNSKFQQHFEKLFAEANSQGPDYYEFAKMVEAMHIIPDEKSRYMAAFAGLRVQGLEKQKLLSTAGEYLKMVDADSAAFQQSIDATLQAKVQSRKAEMEEKSQRIQQLSQEITELNNRISALQTEIRENEEKILTNGEGYRAAAETVRQKILLDIERIKQHVE